MQKPLVSIIITTKNEERNMRRLLGGLVKQSYKNVEIIVVDNNSTDQTRAIALAYTRHVYTKGPERSVQRNFGAEKAKGKYLLFLDADMTLEPGVVGDCVSEIDKRQLGAVVIPEKSIGRGFWAACKAFERECYIGDVIIEAARFFQKSAFESVGGYDEDLTGPEDWDLPQRVRAKYAIGRVQSYIIHHEGTPTLWGLVRKKLYYGRRFAKYLRKHPIQVTGQQVVYFLRPAFYRGWRKYLAHPILAMGMIVMLTSEQIAGFVGYVLGVVSER